MTTSLSLAQQYLDSFFGPDSPEAMRPILADDLIFEGPLKEGA